MSYSQVIAIILTIGFFSNSVSTAYNLTTLLMAILLTVKLKPSNIYLKKEFTIVFILINLSMIFFRLVSDNTNMEIFSMTDFIYIYISSITSYYLSKSKYLIDFIKTCWNTSLVVWLLYIILLIYSLTENGLSFTISPTSLIFNTNNSLRILDRITYGLIYKPLISLLLVFPFIICIYAPQEIKKSLHFSNLNLKKSISVIASCFIFIIIPSRSIQLSLIIVFIIDYIIKISRKYNLSKLALKLLSILIPSTFIFILLRLKNIIESLPQLLVIDSRVSIWAEAVNFLKDNKLSYFSGPGYSQVDDILLNNIGISNRIEALIERVQGSIKLDNYGELKFFSGYQNFTLLKGFESDFVNGIIGLGLIPFLIIMIIILYKLLTLIYFNKDIEYNNPEKYIYSRYIIALVFALFIEDRGAYMITWILITTILHINYPLKSSVKLIPNTNN